MSEAQPTNKWCGDPNCLQCVDKEPDPYVHLPREDYDALRAENARLKAEYVKLFRLAEPIAKMMTELKIIPIGCSLEQELAWKMTIKNFRHYQRDYESDVLLQAALQPERGRND